MKKKQARFRIYVFCALLIVPTLVWIVLRVTGAADQLDYDTGENRNKYHFSEELNVGNVTEELESYYDDRVPFRSILLSADSDLNAFLEIPYNNVIEPALIELANRSLNTDPEKTAEGSEESKEETSSVEENTGEERVEEGSEGHSDTESSGGTAGDVTDEEGKEENTDDSSTKKQAPDLGTPGDVSLGVTDTSALEPFYMTPEEDGYYPFKMIGNAVEGRDDWLFYPTEMMEWYAQDIKTEEEMAEMADLLTQVQTLCETKGKTIGFIFVPDKNGIYPEYMPSVDRTEPSGVDIFMDYLAENTGLKFDYLKNNLLGAKAYHQLYLSRDTHWNSYGAMVGVQAIHNMLEQDPIDLAAMTYKTYSEILGDLNALTGEPESSYIYDSEYRFDYKTDVTAEKISNCDPGEAEEFGAEYRSDSPNDQTALLIGDSYRDQMAIYMEKDYSHFYSIHGGKLATEQVQEYVEETDAFKNADVIIVECVQRNVFITDFLEVMLKEMIEMLS